MRGKGVNYDTGFSPGGESSRPVFDPEIVRREMQVIASELGCTAVRITGGEPERLTIAAERAVAAGLEVWFSPFPCELPAGQLAPLLADCADRAEHLRRSGARVVLVTGAELTMFASGFCPARTSSTASAACSPPARSATPRSPRCPASSTASSPSPSPRYGSASAAR